MPNAGAACRVLRSEFEQYLDERARLEVVAMEPLVEYIEDGEQLAPRGSSRDAWPRLQ